MGAGKTTYGKRFARDINYAFLDLDQKIEADYGKTIAEIFRTPCGEEPPRQRGKTRFRKP